tara:strand:- start:125 stop:628 length:504 start_codon:yes stop_codon:yes gene_type:complete
MKQLLITIAAVVLVGCGESQPPARPTAKAPDISIHSAASNGNIEAFKQHIAAGTNVNEVDPSTGMTPLHNAARSKSSDKKIVELLIANGAHVNAGDILRRTPLHMATLMGHKELAELLITKGADINVRNSYGETPLDWAIEHKQTETANLLRKHGGKPGEELKAEGK